MPQDEIQEKINDLNVKMGEIETLLKNLSDSSTRTPSVEERFKSKMQEMETRLIQLTSQLESPKAALQAAVKSQIERFESKIEQMSAERREQIFSIESDLKSKIEFVETRLSAIASDTEQHRRMVSKETEMVLRMERLEASLKRIYKEKDESTGELRDFINQKSETLQIYIDELRGKIKQEETPDAFLLRSRLTRLEEQFQKLKQQIPDTFSSEFQGRVQRIEERIQDVEAVMVHEISGKERQKEKDQLQNDIRQIQSKLDRELLKIDEALRSASHQLESGKTNWQQSYADLQERMKIHFKELETQIEELRSQSDHSQSQREKEKVLLREETKNEIQKFKEKLEVLDTRAEKNTSALTDKFKSLESAAQAGIEECKIQVRQTEQKLKDATSDLSVKVFEAALQNRNWKALEDKMADEFHQVKVESLKDGRRFNERFHRHIVERFHQKVRQTGTAFGVILFLAIVGLGAYFHFWIGHQIRHSMSAQFAQPELKDVLRHSAFQMVPVLLEKVSAHLISEAHEKLRAQQEAFERYSEDIKLKYDQSYRVVSDEAYLIKERHKMSDWEEEALVLGSRQAYESIKRYLTSRQELALIAGAILKRVSKIYTSLNRVQSFTLSYESSGKVLKNAEIPKEGLLNFLAKDLQWEARAKAAELLAACPEEGVSQALLKAAQEDPHLEVLRNALISFEKITGYKGSDPLDPASALVWWEESHPAT